MSEGKESTSNEGQRKVLVAVDGSEHSDRAFDYFLKHVCRSGDDIIVLHVLEMPNMVSTPYPFAYPSHEQYEHARKKCDEDAKHLLQKFGERFKDRTDITFKLIKEFGSSPEHTICKNIKEENASLVVIGTRGQGAVRRTVLGSVSNYVVHHCHIPVCIIPPLPL